MIAQHLVKVYGTIACGIAACALGVVAKVSVHPIISVVVCLFLMVYLTVEDTKHVIARMACFLTIAFVNGLSISPLVYLIEDEYPGTVLMAFTQSMTIFVVFSLTTIYAGDVVNYWAPLAGSVLTMLVVASILNVYIGSITLLWYEIYTGLILFCFYVTIDTFVIVQKYRDEGDDDFILHALNLFLDILNIFIRILVIIAESKKKEEKDKDD